ncbi:IPT/TIG domain-containing protein [Spirillospora sp. NPDC047279]|uniref:IPT/TIG domain-containing protein n=1 Tax=Spirillospora sp. NPDC047279 TaxID=3155478 RepID=UPI0033C04900
MGQDSPVGTGFARVRDIVVIAVLLVLLTSALTIVLVQAWPPSAARTGLEPPSHKAVHLFGWSPRVSRETSLFVIVLAAGAIGGTLHALRSLYWYVGNRTLKRSWLMMYLFLPFIGAAFGLVVYLVLRGGLTSPAGGSADINPYGITAIAAMVGLFSQETAEKLRAVFGTLFAPAQAGRDQALPPQVRSLEPASGVIGALVTLHGVGLGSATSVRFGAADAPATDVSDELVRVTVPANAASGRPVVVTPAGSAVSPMEFTVDRDAPHA